MATWGLHIRIAEELLKKDFDLHDESFLVGNIGPDSGMPNEDWSKFEPSTEISHWKIDGTDEIDAEKFHTIYLNKSIEDKKRKSFLIGYYVHLITDIEFSKLCEYKKEHDKNYEPLKNDKKFIWTIKEDWYDLDHLYFRNNPNSMFFTIFQNIEDFPDYLDYFPKGAVMEKIKFITNYYQNPSDNLDREYIYLSMDEMNEFVHSTTKIITEILSGKLIS